MASVHTSILKRFTLYLITTSVRKHFFVVELRKTFKERSLIRGPPTLILF